MSAPATPVKPIEIVRASAGSGKTYRLAVQYIAAAIMQPSTAFRHILAVTFTNKATTEMKERIIEQLHKLSLGTDPAFAHEITNITGLSGAILQRHSKETLAAILTDYSAFAVSTIDKFSQKIIRSFFRELGLDMDYKVMIDTKASIPLAIDSLIARSLTDRGVRVALDSLAKSLLDGSKRINFRREFADIFGSYLSKDFAVAPAFDIAQLFADYAALQMEYDQILATLRGHCQSLLNKVATNGLQPEDFRHGRNSFACYARRVVGGSLPVPSSYVREFAKKSSAGTSNGKISDDVLSKLMPDMSAFVALYYESEQFRNSFELLRPNFHRFVLLGALKGELDGILKQQGMLSLSDSSSLLSRITGEAGVPFIFERLGERYTRIFIDEFQDTSLGQWGSFEPLISEIAADATTTGVMLIGDIKQAIYRFRGGDWRLLGGGVQAQFEGRFTPISLTTSWRSEPLIVEFNNSVMQGVVISATRFLGDFLGGADAKSRALAGSLTQAYGDAQQAIAPHKQAQDTGYVEVSQLERDDTMTWLLDNVQRISAQSPDLSIAVLVRTSADGRDVAEAMMARRMEFMSQEALKLNSAPVVLFLIACLRYSVQPADMISLAQINAYVGRDFALPLSPAEVELFATLRSLPLRTAIDTLIFHYNLQSKPTDTLYLQALQECVYQFSCGQMAYAGIPAFLEQWDSEYSNRSVPLTLSTKGGVQILSIHKSKGLEFDVVFVPFANWKLFPRATSDLWAEASDPAFAAFGTVPVKCKDSAAKSFYAEGYFEEGVFSVVDAVNLLYVALTRAKSQLYVGVGPDPQKAPSLGNTDVSTLLRSNLTGLLPEVVGKTGILSNGGAVPDYVASEVAAAVAAATNTIEIGQYHAQLSLPVELHIEEEPVPEPPL